MSTLNTDAGIDDVLSGVTYCPSCGHRDEVHDATSKRYCAATLHSGAERGCICRGDLTDKAPGPG